LLNQTGYQAYQKNKYETASPHRLIQMLYEGALKNISGAIKALENKEINESHLKILKAQDIISELLSSLNEEHGGTIATNLKNIYLYMLERLVQANIRKDNTPLLEVARLLQEIKSAWDQIGREVSVGHG